ncbi:unnamed protein product [Phytophthora fragariaefolia]|uniref:Unnamed protein product n=1 Tax=Phytophthora fragariaefolia TaxID=1490495 RepID=A0A9W6TUH5_9STRA|nr:unnamed protein product [Phytophthora fragariaefolia]
MTGDTLHHKRKQPSSERDAAVSPASKQLETDELYDVPVGIATDRGGKLNQEVHADFCNIARHASSSAVASAARRSHGRSFATDDGSTLLVAIVRDGLLHVGNVGDSRAVVVTRNGDAIAMSFDQKPNRKDERERLEANGAFVTGKPDFMYKVWPLKKMLDVPRVNGQLAVSRSIGDVSLKSYISCEPEVQTRKISKNDRFLILATDGLWDVVTNKTAAQLAARFKDPQAAADALVELALEKRTTDNVTVMVVKLEAYDFTTSRTDVTTD